MTLQDAMRQLIAHHGAETEAVVETDVLSPVRDQDTLGNLERAWRALGWFNPDQDRDEWTVSADGLHHNGLRALTLAG